ncbi:hypothetical protein NC99_42550 [Sunxiuqinia dokdonensis]|uniref:Uncharacterized protein n=1 Tax=Sunxiuqinia dokdonensis TaxID=1409788 RepID=A0A0L8V3J9_9BACT|nr:hypothetical protein NC99_42550 [Sunxiuqinia dokdonensis]
MANSEILLYQTEDGQTKIDVRLEKNGLAFAGSNYNIVR